MDATTHFTIPNPPLNPFFASESQKNDRHVLAYNTRGYSRLVKSLPDYELSALEQEMENIAEGRAKDLADRMNARNIVLNGSNTREITVMALKALQMNLLSIEQVATLHIIDGAISDLLTHPTMYLQQKFVRDETVCNNITVFPIPPNPTYPSSYMSRPYTSLGFMSEDCNPKDFPKKFNKPFLKRFFSLTKKEWKNFCQRMEDPQRAIPPSEKQFYLFNAPEFGCLSMLAKKVQEVIKLFHPKKVVEKLKTGQIFYEKKMGVPSFSMLQLLLEVKGLTLRRPALKFIATYNRLDEVDYAHEKMNGLIPLGLYFPENSFHERYNRNNPNFRGTIDGWHQEGPFASMIHDVYHALREMAMSPNIAQARFRLEGIAQEYPGFQSDKISAALIDGELIHSYHIDKDTTFNSKKRPAPQIFGDLFYTLVLKEILHPELKEAFIKDMANNKDEWKENFDLGREDLRPIDQKIYDQFAENL